MRLRSRKTAYVALALLIAVVLPLAVYLLLAWHSGNEVAHIVAELDRTAAPWRLADLQALEPNLPDERNGAVILKAARLGNARGLLDQADFDLPANKLLPGEVCERLQECLEKYDANLKEARRLVDFPEGQFAVKIAPDVISTLIPHVQDVREVALLLKNDAYWQIQQANFEQAAESCTAAVHAARTLRGELFFISHLVRIAMLRETAVTLERMFAQGQPPARLLSPFAKLLKEEAEFDAWRRATAGERAGLHQLFEYIEANKMDLRLLRGLAGMRRHWHTDFTDYFIGVNARQSHAWMLRHQSDVLAALQLPPHERLAKLKELDDSIAKAPELARTLMAPAWRINYSRFLRSQTKLYCTVAALAAEQFRQKNQRWPGSLDELTPEFLTAPLLDSYTGEPLKLRATADGIVIFSPGPDAAWQGTARDEPRGPELDQKLDHEFRLWNVEKRRSK